MEAPRVDGLKLERLIGYGECGKVYAASGADGQSLAVKLFESMAIERGLLARMTRRLEDGGWPDGVMRVLWADFDGRPCHWVTGLVADVDPDGHPVPRSLQHLWDEHPGERTWEVVRGIASALAAMHRRRVAHGNLKPGNVFLSQDGGVLLGDWCLGNMPGVGQLMFTDALLYQPPEQLSHAGGYLEEEGYGWDVFAFGSLAYRLLTGRFPRCHETFSGVCPPTGSTRRDGIHADLPKIAANLVKEPEIVWPDPAANELEEGLREWITRCLELDKRMRPASMIEVAAGFELVENDAARHRERDELLDLRRRAERRARRAFFGLGMAAAAALVTGGLWQLTASQLSGEKRARQAETKVLKDATEAAMAARIAAEQGERDARQSLKYERELGIARLEASRLIGDRLFAWAMEKGHRQLPALDGRELRLKRLERYFVDFLERTGDTEELRDERARVRLQLAEVSLAAGDAEAATRRLAEALEGWPETGMDAELKLRMATNSLLLALLRQSLADPGSEAAFVEARRALEDVPQAGVDADRLGQLLAILDFHKAQILAAKGREAEALEQLLRATESLNRLADARPDAAVLRSELAACYLSSATILEGMGRMGDAREVRMLASRELVKLLEKTPGDPRLRLELAGCYGAMAEAALMSGDIAGAGKMSEEALKLLDALISEQPDHAEAISRKAAQLGLQAGILRDRGKADDATRNLDEAIRMLEGVRAASPKDVLAGYRLALLWWQQGRMLGMDGKRAEEIRQLEKARALLADLEGGPLGNGPRPEQLETAGAYVAGDLGHALQLAKRTDEAKVVFGEALVLWEGLVRTRPQSEEYQEGLGWCRQRLAELK
jgi:eukaryotic-like serine/threonine-protein kinase